MEHIFVTYADAHIVFTGDLFDDSSPNWEVYQLFLKYASKHKKEIHIVHGNHEWSRIKGSAIIPLNNFNNIFVHSEPTFRKIDNTEFFFMPYMYSKEKIADANKLTGSCDYIVSHITPLKYSFGYEVIKLQVKPRKLHIYGHIHVSDEYVDNDGVNCLLVSVPQTTREGEQKEEKRLIAIDENNEYRKIPLPIFMDIETIQYGDTPKDKRNYINVLNAPSVKAVMNQYKDYYIRKSGIQVARSDQENQEKISLNFSDDIVKKFQDWSQKANIPAEVSSRAVHYLQKCS
jgi:3',5'-cyclic AMP phosphodiesterase CpdA